MMRTAVNILVFAAVSLAWWVVAYTITLMAAIGPCGMGPDAACDVSPFPLWLAFGGALVGYAGLAVLVIRRMRSR